MIDHPDEPFDGQEMMFNKGKKPKYDKKRNRHQGNDVADGPSKAAATELVKYATSELGIGFKVCVKVFKGGVLKLWIEKDNEDAPKKETDFDAVFKKSLDSV